MSCGFGYPLAWSLCSFACGWWTSLRLTRVREYVNRIGGQQVNVRARELDEIIRVSMT
jgi:hypothetical protein